MCCPDTSCGREALPTEVKRVVSTELYQRYDELLLELTLSEMDDMTRCPLIDCQRPATITKGEGKTRDMGTCSACGYNFCTTCQKLWHGVANCDMEDVMKIAKAYKKGSAAQRAVLEKKHGKEQLAKVLEKWERELKHEYKSERYLAKNTVECPKCSTPISKTDGCNKMVCKVCSALFCYLCGRAITGYAHFDTGGCGGKLFDGLEGAADRPWRFQDDSDSEDDPGGGENDGEVWQDLDGDFGGMLVVDAVFQEWMFIN